jgi:hypothetical protein
MNPGSDRDAERSRDESRRGPLRDARERSAADAAPRDDEAWRAPSFKTAPGAARGALRAPVPVARHQLQLFPLALEFSATFRVTAIG